jgi:hypothetical protein
MPPQSATWRALTRVPGDAALVTHGGRPSLVSQVEIPQQLPLIRYGGGPPFALAPLLQTRERI